MDEDATLPVRLKMHAGQPLILIVTPAVSTIINAAARSLSASVTCSQCERPLYAPIITSGLDGVHGAGSDHHDNGALDFRSVGWPRNPDSILRALKAELPAGYRYLMEGDHLHVERHYPGKPNVTA